jgi:hypothetical protein
MVHCVRRVCRYVSNFNLCLFCPKSTTVFRRPSDLNLLDVEQDRPDLLLLDMYLLITISYSNIFTLFYVGPQRGKT